MTLSWPLCVASSPIHTFAWRELAPIPADDCYSPKHEAGVLKACGIPENPRKVLEGGSHLSALNYCSRYRPVGRHPEPVDTSTSHIGFRCLVRAAGASR